MEFDKKTLDDILSHTKGNESDILHSEKCVCLFCRQRFDARKVSDWSNEGNKISAVCPECGMTAVVGDHSGYTFTHSELKEANEKLYGVDFMEKHPENIRKYIHRYRERKITHKPVNEALYIHYLQLLAEDLFDADASFYLGELYEFGSPFTLPDKAEALLWYEAPCLKFDGEALTRAGIIYQGFQQDGLAFQSFTKAAALGSTIGLIHLSDCYMEGRYVFKDKDFALRLLHNMFDETYTRFIASSGNDCTDFASLCYRLGKVYMKKGDPLAIKLFLCAKYAYSIIEENNNLIGELYTESRSTNRYLNKLAKEQGYQKGTPVLDASTFLNSLNPFSEEKGRYDLYIPCSLRDVSYSEEDQTLSFVTDSVYPFLIVDPQNLYCQFLAQNETNWIFENVSSFNGFNKEGNTIYNRIFTDGNNQIRFINTFAGGGPLCVGEIFFDSSKMDDEHNQEETEKA